MPKPFIVYYNRNSCNFVQKFAAEEIANIGQNKCRLAIKNGVAIEDIVAQFEYIKEGIESLGLGNACEVL